MVNTTFKLAVIVTLFFTGICKSQEFQGKAEYFSKRILKDKIGKVVKLDKEMDPELDKIFQQALKKASEKQYLLTFNKSEALYEEKQEMEKPDVASRGMAVMVSFSDGGKKYLNVKDMKSTTEDEIFGKEFLIVEPLVRQGWKLIDENKKIGDYNCFKAELLIPVTEKEKKGYEEFLKKEEIKPALFKMEKPEDKVVTAWYTPEIPVNFGPDNYWGLPGLILEINDGESIILCSKVTLGNKETSKIKVPNVGQKVSRDEFNKIQTEKMDSMKNDDGVIIHTIER